MHLEVLTYINFKHIYGAVEYRNELYISTIFIDIESAVGKLLSTMSYINTKIQVVNKNQLVAKRNIIIYLYIKNGMK